MPDLESAFSEESLKRLRNRKKTNSVLTMGEIMKKFNKQQRKIDQEFEDTDKDEPAPIGSFRSSVFYDE